MRTTKTAATLFKTAYVVEGYADSLEKCRHYVETAPIKQPKQLGVGLGGDAEHAEHGNRDNRDTARLSKAVPVLHTTPTNLVTSRINDNVVWLRLDLYYPAD